MGEWTRIPVPIDSDADRRNIASILFAWGLEVRPKKVRLTPKGTPRNFIEYRIHTGTDSGKTGDRMP